jgi:hypothetical protein
MISAKMVNRESPIVAVSPQEPKVHSSVAITVLATPVRVTKFFHSHRLFFVLAVRTKSLKTQVVLEEPLAVPSARNRDAERRQANAAASNKARKL